MGTPQRRGADVGAKARRHEQIADSLRATIRSGSLRPGDRLPSESQIMAEYGVARETARTAIGLLRGEGLVVTRKGAGTYVRPFKQIVRSVPERLSHELREAGQPVYVRELAGRDLETDRIEIRRTRARSAIRVKLGLPKNATVVVRHRRYVVDQRPVQIANSHIPLDLATKAGLTRVETGPGGMYARFAEVGHDPVHFVERVKARTATIGEAANLELAKGTWVIAVSRIAFDGSGMALELNEMVLDASVYELVYEFDA